MRRLTDEGCSLSTFGVLGTPHPRKSASRTFSPSPTRGEGWCLMLPMPFDSLGLLSALALFAAGIATWFSSAGLRAGARIYLRFAAMLFTALCAAYPLGLVGAASLLLLPLAAGALVIAAMARFASPLPVFTASLVLILGLACGLAAPLTGLFLMALVPTAIAGLIVMAASLNHGDGIAGLAGTALALSALSSWNHSAQAGLFLFCAAALLGLSRPRH